MKPISKIAAISIVGMLFFACNNSSREEQNSVYGENTSAGSSDSIATDDVSSSAAKIGAADSTRKFKRTADLHFEVKDVIKSTTAIEDIANKQGGFVTLSAIQNQIQSTNEVEQDEDSSLAITKYQLESKISIRVPASKLDTVLREIAKHVHFLNSRNIIANDVSLLLQANTKAVKRAEQSEQRINKAISNKSAKLGEHIVAENSLSERQDKADEKQFSKLNLLDEVAYSTVELELYQRATVRKEMVASEKDLAEYKPGFGTRLSKAFVGGFEFFKSFLLVLVTIWPFFFIVIIALIVYRRYFMR